MSCYYKFNEDDVFYNIIKTHPSCEYYIYSGSVYYNNKYSLSGAINFPVKHVPSGNVSLYELNIDRDEVGHTYDTVKDTGNKSLIYPFVTKNGSFMSFKTITTKNFNDDFQYGDILSGSYPLSATIVREYFAEGPASEINPEEPDASTGGKQVEIVIADPNKKQGDLKTIIDAPGLRKPHIIALRNTLDYYTGLSEHYAFSTASLPNSSVVNWNKGEQELNLISVPSIFYGSSIKKGTMDLRFYYTGSIIGQLKDEKQDGELIQVGPPGSNKSGSVAGIVLYNEGLILLTGSWRIPYEDETATEPYKGTIDGERTGYPPSWVYFGAGMSQEVDTTVPSSSFYMAFSGTTPIPTITMLAHARRGDLNWSNNPTYIKYGELTGSTTGSTWYKEYERSNIKNTVSSSFECGHTASFKKQTFINKVGIYDKDKNLIAIAKMSTPVRKLETDEYTFKLKLDI